MPMLTLVPLNRLQPFNKTELQIGVHIDLQCLTGVAEPSSFSFVLPSPFLNVHWLRFILRVSLNLPFSYSECKIVVIFVLTGVAGISSRMYRFSISSISSN